MSSMTKKERQRITEQSYYLAALGFSYQESEALRLISVRLSRWAEDECNGLIERDELTDKPRRMWETFKGERRGTLCHDREKGAIRRLEAILASHPEFSYYHQTDPRGASLYLIPKAKLEQSAHSVDCCYSSIGVCVY